jgi:uncharacterized membrane-anchored protein YhcB (DUF1043 family)
MCWLSLFIGLFVGATIGVLVMAITRVGAKSDRGIGFDGSL